MASPNCRPGRCRPAARSTSVTGCCSPPPGAGRISDELYERAITLAADALEQHDPRPVASARPATQRARQALVDDVRETLVIDPDLAAELGFADQSHLHRGVRQQTGRSPSALRRALA